MVIPFTVKGFKIGVKGRETDGMVMKQWCAEIDFTVRIHSTFRTC